MPQRGSTFSIYLPRTQAPIAAEDLPTPLPRGNGERVLLVDDEANFLAMTAQVLSRLGYQPVSFSDSHAALAVGISELLVKPLQSRAIGAALARALHAAV
jgi:CheY-like chemotaxis protein